MDWVELLFLFLIFGLPLLGKLFRKPEAPPTLPPVGDEREEVSLPPAPLSVPPESAQQPAEWSSGWNSWPDEDLSENPAWEEGFSAEGDSAEEEVRVVSLETLPPEISTLQLHRPDLPAYAISAEALQVDRAAEHARFHRATRHVARPSVPVTDLAAELSDPAELRRAIIFAEILGPPISLRK